MPGALLEAVGQVRNTAPFILSQVVSVNIAASVAGSYNTFKSAPLTVVADIPFDRGPDKSGRVFVAVNGVSVIITAGTYAAAGQVVGNLFFRGTSGLAIHLLSFADFIPNAIHRENDRIFIENDPLFGGLLSNIGTLEWNDVASIASTTQDVTLRCNLNIGFYGEYAEFNFDRLHEEIHNIPKLRAQVDLTPV